MNKVWFAALISLSKETVPIMFIPASVGLITYWDQLKAFWLPLLVIAAVSTLLVMVVTGKVTDLCLKNKEGK